MQNIVNQRNILQFGGDVSGGFFTPPISQVTFAQIRGKKWIGIKQKSLITV